MHFDAQDRHDAHEPPPGATPEAAPGDGPGVCDRVSRRHRELLKSPHEAVDFTGELSSVAAELCSLAGTELDMALFQTIRRDPTDDAAVHSFSVALICAALGRRLGMNRSQTQCLVSAALTMNIAMIELQRQLWSQSTPLTYEQREEIRLHPQRGRRWLESLGVEDADWLRAVEEHHESDDGSGYPRGIRDPGTMAHVIRNTDTYCAMLGARAYRAPLPANQAARRLYMLSDRRQDSIPAMIIEEVGIFPPGSYVKLANGEAGVVVHRGESASTPVVVSLFDGNGHALSETPARDTRVAKFSVSELLPLEDLQIPLDLRSLFGLQESGPLP